MYSKSKGITDRDYYLTPPPGYDGSRFRQRSDGRDDSFPLYGDEDMLRQKKPRERTRKSYRRQLQSENREVLTDKACETALLESKKDRRCPTPDDKWKKNESENPLLSFIGGMDSEELLLISLIVLLAGGAEQKDRDTVLLLSLLLCIS